MTQKTIRAHLFSKTAAGIFATSLGIAIPIAWSWWSTKSELTFQKEQATNIIEKKTSIEGLSIRYLDQEIESLSKITYILKNTGRTPIEKSDLISAPILKIQDGKLLSIAIDTTYPENLGATIEKKTNSAEIFFPLLNPGDSITISALVSGQTTNSEIESRIKNISKIQITDATQQPKIRTNPGWTFYVALVFTILLLLIFLTLLIQIPKRKRALASWRSRNGGFQAMMPSTLAILYIEGELSFLSRSKRENLKNIAEKHGDKLSPETAIELQTSITHYIDSDSPGSAAVFISVLIAGSIYYLVKSIIT